MGMESETLNLVGEWEYQKYETSWKFKEKKQTSAWRVQTKHLHGEWELTTCLESDSSEIPWKIKIEKINEKKIKNPTSVSRV